ncbi:MAG: hypothetical protein M1833_004244 [Piccolia ochrophora]|nr:MAG: hypothetical protein M1833_004244 [Piccolia ochrophora]
MSANPLKRRSNNESPPRRVASKVASRESAWDKTTYRISNIPTTFDVPHLADTVADVLELESSSDVKIGSLCLDAVDQGDPQHKVATASFRVRPALLSSKSEGVDDTSAKPLAEWQFSLPHVEDGEIHFDIHFHGFTPLSPVEMQERRTIEFVQLKYFYSVGAKPSSCVAIHGWGGHAFGSYRATGASYMWLRDSLPKHFPKLRVWIYGYESNLSDSHSTSNVYEDAENFRRALRILRRKIVHKAMIRMKDSEIQDDQLNFQLTYGALFFGVPGQGMDVENLATMVHNLPARYNLSLLDQQMGFRLRNRQHEDFCRAYDYRDSKIVQFFELKKSPTFRKASQRPLPEYRTISNITSRTIHQTPGRMTVLMRYWLIPHRRSVEETGKEETNTWYRLTKTIKEWSNLPRMIETDTKRFEIS